MMMNNDEFRAWLSFVAEQFCLFPIELQIVLIKNMWQDQSNKEEWEETTVQRASSLSETVSLGTFFFNCCGFSGNLSMDINCVSWLMRLNGG